MKLFEYMACMRPVVTSNHGQMKEVINDGVNGLLCTNDAGDILEKLVLLKDDFELAATIGRNGWECVQQELSWQSNVEKTLALFEKILSKSAS
ncbi:MAG: glycosyltransferase, partial [Thiotrichaceae bacterium]|nr:glycosyltransferase [Thiotrichaceae bacterium]